MWLYFIHSHAEPPTASGQKANPQGLLVFTATIMLFYDWLAIFIVIYSNEHKVRGNYWSSVWSFGGSGSNPDCHRNSGVRYPPL